MKTLSYDPRIKEFLLGYFDLIGAEVETLSADLIRAKVPEEHAQAFDGKSEVLLAFRFADMKGHDDAEFITFGSYYLDNVIRNCLTRGEILQRYVDCDPATRQEPLAQAAKLDFPAVIPDCTIAPGDAAHVYLPYLTFTFLIRYNADTKIEEIRSVTIDPRTRGPIAEDEMEFIRSCALREVRDEAFQIRRDECDASLDAARRQIEQEIGKRGREIEGELAPRLQKELAHLEAYYTEAIGEAKESRRQNASDEVARLEKERSVRIEEETGRYRLIVEYRLLSVSCLHYPFAERTFRVCGNSVTHDVAIRYDLPRARPMPLLCEACSAEYHTGALCENGHLVCANCVRVCGVCAKKGCAKCVLGQCHITQKPVCERCGFTCESCGKIASNEHKVTCHSGGETICSACAVKCSICGEVSCRSHMGKCAVCNAQACKPCLRQCHVCGMPFCFEHTAECLACGRISCLRHRRTCSICRQTWCQSCFAKADICTVCSDALQGQATELPSEVRTLVDVVGVGGEMESFKKWQMGENERILVLIGKSFFGKKVIVIDKTAKSLVHSHRVGLLGRLFGRK